MPDCNSFVNYGPYMIIYQCQEKNHCNWCYNVVLVGGGPVPIGKVPVPKPVGLLQNATLSIVIPLCEDIKPCQVTDRTVTCAEDFCTKVGLDPDTNIYGIRFDILNPFTSFTVCFKTPPREPENQIVGLIVEETVYNDQEICSPSCTHLHERCGKLKFKHWCKDFWHKFSSDRNED